MLEQLKSRARALKRETLALYFAVRDPRTPWYAKSFAALVIAYAFSPIDLIPDFIPVIGYLDDLILVPAGIALALKMIPREVMEEARLTAAAQGPARGVGMIGASVIITIWIAIAVWAILLAIQIIQEKL
ncbi:MAG: DUF1232 domain-containing protein [Chloroflexi bacterium]|nr:DUF1232 domain-containing protein [Chloroflexota bacterium]MBI3340024.1 DUF1232 domain-containing protein [Chloroflexota bacterium]